MITRPIVYKHKNKEETLMNNFKHLQRVLFKEVQYLNRFKSLFVENSKSDFVRKRKLSFDKTIMDIISLETGSLKDELLKLNNYAIDTPSTSAFVQARSKIRVEAFETLFKNFNSHSRKEKTYKGYRLLAIDGSTLPIDNSIIDDETTQIKVNQSNKTFSAFHLNASYDLLECSYDDLIIQGQNHMDENDAFCRIVDRYKGTQSIFIADRGYESYNGCAHVANSKNKYLIRIKDIYSKTSMARSFGPFSEEEFDIDIKRILTLKCTNEIKSNPEIYKWVPSNMNFDYMSKEYPYYDFECRLVRFKIAEGTYECIITNLNHDSFTTEEIKELYHKRWGIETSFREIKYALGLNALHAKKRKLIKQEIYARILLYNFSQRIIGNIHIKHKKTKYIYQINFTRAFHIIRKFINKKSGNPLIDDLIAKEILPIRLGRHNMRNLSPKKVVCFNYRFD